MAFDAFLKIDGIAGESNDKFHKDEIEISSFSWGVTQTGSIGSGGGGGAGKASFQDLHFTSSISKASPNLMIKCATGEHIKEGTLTVRKGGGDKGFEFMKVRLTDVLISSYQNGGSSSDGLPTDQFSLNFGKIEFDYTVEKTGENIHVAYDQRFNKEA
jgi:type VI secretion system secreted protein Hcp